jgi:hypothetical protein
MGWFNRDMIVTQGLDEETEIIPIQAGFLTTNTHLTPEIQIHQ